ncbi:MAG: Serine/threonine-protein kinase PknD [Phycisphaerae bacterium]|nr:Serine/threonine-protein kinase PknD [Phycisphaerae bacterium]
MSTKYQTGLRVSEYVLEECVGSGAFAEVWRARHHIWESEQVAVKLPLQPEFARYLRREGAVVHGVRHANVVRVLGIDPYGEIPYLVMELVRGPSLKSVIVEHRTGVPVDLALRVFRGILTGLAAAHEANVIHRDIKPGNILLDLNGKPLSELRSEQVKLGDFGFGLADVDAMQSIAQSASISRSDALVGTIAYMAPELRDGHAAADEKSDLYAVGVVLFELLTGERPAGAELPSSVRPAISPALDELFKKLYARHDRRYASANAVLHDLDARVPAPDGAPGAPHLPPLPESGRPRSSRANWTCGSCHRPADPADQFCIHCGAQLVERVRRCPGCDGFPGVDDRFCIFCGASLPPVTT